MYDMWLTFGDAQQHTIFPEWSGLICPILLINLAQLSPGTGTNLPPRPSSTRRAHWQNLPHFVAATDGRISGKEMLEQSSNQEMNSSIDWCLIPQTWPLPLPRVFVSGAKLYFSWAWLAFIYETYLCRTGDWIEWLSATIASKKFNRQTDQMTSNDIFHEGTSRKGNVCCLIGSWLDPNHCT